MTTLGLRRASLLLALALVLVIAGFEGSASAALTGRQVVQAGTPPSSANKSVTATCPAGKQVTGGGGDINGLPGFEGQVAINDVIPNAALTSVTVQGLEDQNGYANTWAVVAFAVCATPPPGLARVVATSPSDSLSKSVTATCPVSKRVLGAGGEISAGGGQVLLDELTPDSSLTSVRVSGFEAQAGTSSNWLVRAYAICANPVGGLERSVAQSPSDSNNDDTKRVAAVCSPGKEPVGTGGELGGGGGGQVLLDDLSPLSGSVRVRGREDEDGSSSNWFTRGYAICAATSQRVVDTRPAGSEDETGLASCPFDKFVTGVGGDITGGSGQVLIERLSVFASNPDNVFSAGVEDETGTSSNWVLRTYAICATLLPGLEVVQVGSLSDSLNKSATAPCPAGKRVVGAAGGIGSSGNGDVMPSAIAPNPALTSVTVTGEEDENGTTADWSLGATAICATPPPGLELVSVAGDPDSDPASGVTAPCPSGKNLLGTGAEIVDGGGLVLLDDLRPNAALTTVTVTGFEGENGHKSDWFLRAHAICANP